MKGDIRALKDLFPNPDIDYNGPIIIHAIKNNDVEVVEFLLKRGASIDSYNEKFMTPLMVAVKNNNFKMVEFLLKHHAFIGSVCDKKISALSIAVDSRNQPMINLILTKKDVNMETSDDLIYKSPTPLLSAINMGRSDLVKILLDNGANPNKYSIGTWEHKNSNSECNC